MKAMVLDAPGRPLRLADVPEPRAGAGQVLVRVIACGVCRTDVHIVDGELAAPKLPIIPGHQVVGRVESLGAGVTCFAQGDRVGVPWLGWSCGECPYCASGRENLCDQARYTGSHIDGGYAELCVADARFCFRIPEAYPEIQAAPLLCAGLVGYRALRMTGDAKRIGFYGFGGSAHILTQVARFQGREVFAFTRPGDKRTQDYCRSLGAVWAGGSDQMPPKPLDAAILFAADGSLVPMALKATAKGATVVCAEIHMTDIPSFPYSILWGERVLRSVANLTRRDGDEFLALAPKVPVRTEVHPYPLERANDALDDLRHGRFTGAAVLKIA